MSLIFYCPSKTICCTGMDQAVTVWLLRLGWRMRSDRLKWIQTEVYILWLLIAIVLKWYKSILLPLCCPCHPCRPCLKYESSKMCPLIIIGKQTSCFYVQIGKIEKCSVLFATISWPIPRLSHDPLKPKGRQCCFWGLNYCLGFKQKRYMVSSPGIS